MPNTAIVKVNDMKTLPLNSISEYAQLPFWYHIGPYNVPKPVKLEKKH